MRLASKPESKADKVRSALSMLEGVPQDGYTLGRPDAPATLTMYASLTDLNLGFPRSDLPALLERYVRPGKLKIEMRTVTTPALQTLADDPDAAHLAQIAQAAGLQDRLWDFYVAFGTLYTGTFSSDQEEEALRLAPSIDAKRIAADADSSRVADAIGRADALARKRVSASCRPSTCAARAPCRNCCAWTAPGA